MDGTPVRVYEVAPVPPSASKFVLLIDVSGSNKDKRQFEANSALNLYGQLLDNGYSGYFGDFNDELYLDRKTNTLEAAKREIQQAPPRGSSAIYDAVQGAAKLLAKHSQPGDALSIIVITDGADNASHQDASRVLKDLQKAGVVVHEVMLLDEDPHKKQEDFSTLSRQTGGTTTLLREQEDFANPIVQAFGRQYWIVIQAPGSGDKSLHSITFSNTDPSVKIHGPEKIAIH